ncbi:M28 family peptidase [Brevundimonas goettingensis]|uniref:M28 family peptidase n=1 Tax=Brevundimonas goettingensis TaxID=2774190 RepID=A0A975GWF0_9CAUL|nr:M28 family peptidase [Brevundimonas goettingensis]QTC92576.1 M28 family peptidase [Brevundimonas goettingensis]
MTVRYGLKAAGAALFLAGLAGCATTGAPSSVSGPPPGTDPAVVAWWATTSALSRDDMEGRDTGSEGYRKAAAYVIDRFQRAGLQPAGDNGTWIQSIPLHEVAVVKEGTSFTVVGDDGSTRPLQFLREISVTPVAALPVRLEAPLAFRGYCSPQEIGDVRGKILVCFAGRRAGMTTAAGRMATVTAGDAVALINIDDVGFTVEPPRWPMAYARSVGFADNPPSGGPAFPVMRLSADALAAVIAGSGQDSADILARAVAAAPLPAFDIPARMRLTFAVRESDYSSENVLAVLPGTDPALADQPVLVNAHLDGYGYGEPVDGDGLYNGALDDAAYVATLIEMADHFGGKGLRRPVFFAAYTGEEKGLLGSRWLADHPTPAMGPKGLPVAVLNLDQLRPLYPLTILTTLAVNDTSLGAVTREIAGEMGVEVRADPEPERGLLRRSDHWPFMQKGVPGISFIFGYDPGTEAEARYRLWYQTRYHMPQDDLTTAIDWKAAGDFNRFYETLTRRVADADQAPQWIPGSPIAPAASLSAGKP